MRRVTLVLLLLAFVFAGAPLMAADEIKGLLTVGGTPFKITQAYAYAVPGTFDSKRDDVVVLLCDAIVPPTAQRDTFARRDLIKAGKLHCVQQTIDAKKQVIQFRVEDSRFSMPETGGSTEQVFEDKTFDGKTIAGRARTKSPQKSFDDIPYTYDITFSATIEPKQ
ncbi:MAG TPA: hypothetical protein VLR94_10050 [Acidobacteriota bacterium]|nr:hypothetical protein [Acidobacteriota bacterium]